MLKNTATKLMEENTMSDNNIFIKKMDYTKTYINDLLKILTIFFTLLIFNIILNPVIKQNNYIIFALSALYIIDIYINLVQLFRVINNKYIELEKDEIIISSPGLIKRVLLKIKINEIDHITINYDFLNYKRINIFHKNKKVIISRYFLEENDFNYLVDLLSKEVK